MIWSGLLPTQQALPVQPWQQPADEDKTWVCCPVPAPHSGLRVNASVSLFNGLLCSLALHSQPAGPAAQYGRTSVIKTAGRPWCWTVSRCPGEPAGDQRLGAQEYCLTSFSVTTLRIFLAANPNQLHWHPDGPGSPRFMRGPHGCCCAWNSDTELSRRESRLEGGLPTHLWVPPPLPSLPDRTSAPRCFHEEALPEWPPLCSHWHRTGQ